MSENKPRPETKDRTALYIAIVGATATVIAAAIGVLPNLLNRVPAPAPTPIVVTAAPIPTEVSQVTAIPPTTAPATVNPPTATLAEPTAASRIDFLVANNREGAFDFFIDDEYQITVPAGGYQLLRVIPGEHKLTHCPQGSKPSDANSGCESLSREVRNEPYDWQLGGTVPARDEMLLFLLNQIDHDVDIFVNETNMVPVNAHQIGTIQVAPGIIQIQTCRRGSTPTQGVCGVAGSFEFTRKVEMYVVNVP